MEALFITVESVMNVWVRLCKMAIQRHRLLWAIEGGTPYGWRMHRDLIIAVYGREVYAEAWYLYLNGE